MTEPEPERILDAPAVLRAARRLARLSQRELAQRAGIPPATLARIESGATANPGLATLTALLSAAGCAPVAVTSAGVPLFAHPDEGRRDDGDRHYPAHLDLFRTPGPGSIRHPQWWGWNRSRTWRSPARIPLDTFIRSRSYYNRPLDPRTGQPMPPGRPGGPAH